MAFVIKAIPAFLALSIAIAIAMPLQAQLDLTSSSSDSLLNPQLLRVEQAFTAQGLASDAEVEIIWRIEPGYYMYRKQFRVFADGVEISPVQFDQGEISYDPFFDEELEIYRDETRIAFPAVNASNLEVRFQGCADAGYCYPPSWAAFEHPDDSDSVNFVGLVSGPGQTPAGQPAEGRQALLWTGVGLGLALLISLILWNLSRNPKSSGL